MGRSGSSILTNGLAVTQLGKNVAGAVLVASQRPRPLRLKGKVA